MRSIQFSIGLGEGFNEKFFNLFKSGFDELNVDGEENGLFDDFSQKLSKFYDFFQVLSRVEVERANHVDKHLSYVFNVFDMKGSIFEISEVDSTKISQNLDDLPFYLFVLDCEVCEP